MSVTFIFHHTREGEGGQREEGKEGKGGREKGRTGKEATIILKGDLIKLYVITCSPVTREKSDHVPREHT